MAMTCIRRSTWYAGCFIPCRQRRCTPAGTGPGSTTTDGRKGGSRMNVSVCVCTDRRPRSLQRLLDALVWLRADRVTGSLEVVVLDADPAGSAREACAE